MLCMLRPPFTFHVPMKTEIGIGMQNSERRDTIVSTAPSHSENKGEMGLEGHGKGEHTNTARQSALTRGQELC